MTRTRPLVVGYVEPFYWRGGPHQVLLDLLSNLEDRRFTPVVAVPRQGQVEAELKASRFSVRVVSGARNLRRRRSAVLMGPELLASLCGGIQVLGFIRRNRVRLVHTNNEACWAGPIGARLARVPSVVHVHGLGFANSRFAARQLARVLNTTADRVIAVSLAVETALIEAGVSHERVRVVLNGVAIERFRPDVDAARLRQEFRIGTSEQAVGMFGGLDPRKGHRLFMQAASIVGRSIPSARFFVVGGDVPAGGDSAPGAYRAELEGLARKLGLSERVHFTGERADMPEMLALMDVVVQPSETDAGPLVPLEAMSVGRPVVATNVGGNPEEVAHGESGLIVSPGDAQELAGAVLDLLRDQSLRRRMGAAGRARVERSFSRARMAAQVQAIYDELIP